MTCHDLSGQTSNSATIVEFRHALIQTKHVFKSKPQGDFWTWQLQTWMNVAAPPPLALRAPAVEVLGTLWKLSA